MGVDDQLMVYTCMEIQLTALFTALWALIKTIPLGPALPLSISLIDHVTATD